MQPQHSVSLDCSFQPNQTRNIKKKRANLPLPLPLPPPNLRVRGWVGPGPAPRCARPGTARRCCEGPGFDSRLAGVGRGFWKLSRTVLVEASCNVLVEAFCGVWGHWEMSEAGFGGFPLASQITFNKVKTTKAFCDPEQI